MVFQGRQNYPKLPLPLKQLKLPCSIAKQEFQALVTEACGQFHLFCMKICQDFSAALNVFNELRYYSTFW